MSPAATNITTITNTNSLFNWKIAKCNKNGASKIIFYLLISISENYKSLGNHLLTIWNFIAIFVTSITIFICYNMLLYTRYYSEDRMTRNFEWFLHLIIHLRLRVLCSTLYFSNSPTIKFNNWKFRLFEFKNRSSFHNCLRMVD